MPLKVNLDDMTVTARCRDCNNTITAAVTRKASVQMITDTIERVKTQARRDRWDIGQWVCPNH